MRQRCGGIKEVEWPRAYWEPDTILPAKTLAVEFQMIDSNGEYSDKIDQIVRLK